MLVRMWWKGISPTTMEKYEGSSKKVKIDPSYNPTIPLPCIYPKAMKTGFWRDNRHTHVYCRINYSQDMKISHMPINRWMEKKMWHVYIMEYYATMRKDDIQLSVTTWIDLEHIIPRKRNQRKISTAWCHLYVEI